VNKVTVLFLSCLLGACSADKDESTQVTESGSAVETITSSNSPQGQSYTVDYPVTESGDVVDTYLVNGLNCKIQLPLITWLKFPIVRA
jgi:hypothetical protein